MNYFYDFSKEVEIRDWREVSRKDGHIFLEGRFQARAGRKLLLWDLWRQGMPTEPQILAVNGVRSDSLDPLYIRPRGSRYGMPVYLQDGLNIITAEILPRQYSPENFRMTLVDIPDRAGEVQSFSRNLHAVDSLPDPPETACHLDGGRPGLGRSVMPGRFGYTRGAGLLDCAMSWFGIVTRMFHCGDPRYQKPYVWSYSLRQSCEGPESEESLQVNQLSCQWRRGGVSYRYSLASPGIITEIQSGDIRISKLEFAGDYRCILTAEELSTLNCFSGRLPENWMLLCGSTEFPDVPVMIVLDRLPQAIDYEYCPDGRLSSVVFRGCRKMVTACPFGIESLETGSILEDDFLAEAVRRCRFWARSFLAWPVSVTDYYHLDRDCREVVVDQRYEYLDSTDAWGTRPLYLAPLPPMLTLSGQPLPEEAVDFQFPTKFGWLYGVGGKSSAYRVDMIAADRKYPLADNRTGISEVLQDGLQEYFDFEARFPDNIQSYAYPGAILEAYAYFISMFHFLPEDRRRFLMGELSGRLAKACNPDRKYELLLTDHTRLMRQKPDKEQVYQYYTGSEIRHLPMYNIYERVEPFTKCRYNLCYFNVSMMLDGDISTGSREEVLNFPRAFVENDWGIGLTFYMAAQAALFSGDWKPVKENWDSLKKTFSYFDLFQDWACMGAGYAENGRTWIEGANFGAFPAFQNMARVLGDRDSEELAVYLGAKMLALCEGRFLAGEYFARYYGQQPWYGNRTFQEESIPEHIFQSVPLNLSGERVLPSGVSMLTTDAVYPELFESFRQSIPEKHRALMDHFRTALRNGLDAHNDVEFTYHIMNDSLDPEIPEKMVLENMALAQKTGRFLSEWHDIHRFENCLPKNYMKSQILAWLDMRQKPLWLEFWQGMALMSAEWKGTGAVFRCEKTAGLQKLICGVRKMPAGFSFTGNRAVMKPAGEGRICFELDGTGILTVDF